MNLEMEKVAKQTIDIGTQGPARYQILGEPWVCYVSSDQLTTKLVTKLREQVNKITIKAHWHKKI